MTRPKLDALTALRFFAALVILFHHAGPLFGIAWLSQHFATGQGVSFFFVLSGFILAYNYADKDKPIDIRRFYLNRIARIWPTHVAALLLWIVITETSIPTLISTADGREHLWANLFLLQGFVPIQSYYFSFNPVSWSISTEAFFYLVFPFLFARKGAPWFGLVVSAAALVFMVVLTRHANPPQDSMDGLSIGGMLYINPLARVFEFALGCMACYVFRQIGQQRYRFDTALEVAAVAAAIFGMWASVNFKPWTWNHIGHVATYYIGWTGASPLFAALIIVFARQRGRLSRALATRPMIFLGEISFALYLTHYSLLIAFNRYADRIQGSALWFGVFVACCLVTAALLHVIVEKPFRQLIVGGRPSGNAIDGQEIEPRRSA